MNACHSIEITTPKGILLNGLWFGPKNPKCTFIVVHGLGSNVFSNQDLFAPLADNTSAVLMFSNRGHDTITRVQKIDKRKKKGYKSFSAGAAHEVFTDADDDITGAVQFALGQGSKEIVLIGHSTGAQKSVYYLSKVKKNPVSALILMSPLSDYAVLKNSTHPDDFESLQKIAQALVSQESPHTLLPQTVWPMISDAQRFLSLANPDSKEEIFPYSHEIRKPIELRKIKIPALVILAGRDEYSDRPARNIADWFQKMLKPEDTITVIPGANHSFTEHNSQIRNLILEWKNKM